MSGGLMRAPPQAALAKASAAKARKAVKRSGSAPAKRSFREFTSPAGLQVCRPTLPALQHSGVLQDLMHSIGRAGAGGAQPRRK